MPSKQIIFDLDLTLIRSLRPNLRRTLREARRWHWPINARVYKHLLTTWGNPTKMMVPDDWRGEVKPEALEAMWIKFSKTLVCPPYWGVRQTLRLLQSLRFEMHVFTDRGLESATRHLGCGRIRHYFRRIITRDDTRAYKPDADGLDRIIKPFEMIGHNRGEFLFVGDGIFSDWPCAQAAGVEFVGVTQEPNATREGFMAKGLPGSHVIANITVLPAWLEKRGYI